MIRENKTYTLSCKCKNEITVDSVKQAKDNGWRVIEGYSGRERKNVVEEVICPECVEKERLRKYNSENIRERISAGFYNDFPEKFRDDAIEFVGLKDRPRASKAYSMAYDRGSSGGYSEILDALVDYAELLTGEIAN
jgi:hypothetical protein